MALEKYNKKRRFNATPEPAGKVEKTGKKLRFVVQKHDASHLHYDLRLEIGGVMKSWAVPKGPSLHVSDKRLAVMVEDHPLSYNTFEGTIPKGQYGAGKVIVWDAGTYHGVHSTRDDKSFLAGIKRGEITFFLEGKKLRGAFTLVHFGSDPKLWLLIKQKDEYAHEKGDVLKDNASVLSQKHLTAKAEKRSVLRLPPVHPMLATRADEPFDDPDFTFEIKWDGYRVISHVDHDKVKLYSRNQRPLNDRFPAIARALAKLGKNVVLDGEVIAYDEKGHASFGNLQHADDGTAFGYAVFDILYLDGQSTLGLPLSQRRELLEKIVPEKGMVFLSVAVAEKGKAFFKAAAKMKLEGIMAKRRESSYLPGVRSRDWLKVKTEEGDEAVIAGFTAPRRSRKGFGSLVLGQMKRGKLTFIGHVGTGFDDDTLASLTKRLRPLITTESPFKQKVPVNMPVTWVKPKLVAQVKFAEWTSDGIMRQPVFVGLRDDKPAVQVTGETAPVTHSDKMFFPKLKLTKGDVAAYYDRVAPYVLPHLRDRPESLNRHPDGINGFNFYQKNYVTKTPAFVGHYKRRSASTKKDVSFIVCQNKETLLWMVNLGCIEINPWASRVKTPDHPDYLSIDLDPGDNTFDEVVRVAQEVKKVLDMAGLTGFVKTSGKTGLHIYLPMGAKYHFDEVRSFAEIIATIVHQRLPDITSIERSPAKRKKLVYIDFLQNHVGQTLACPYSLRPVPDATVSAPLQWKEVRKGLRPQQFTYATIFKRLKKYGDLWSDMASTKNDLTKAIRTLQKKAAA